eukprot:766338-Hanusia_phi.AAC.1
MEEDYKETGGRGAGAQELGGGRGLDLSSCSSSRQPLTPTTPPSAILSPALTACTTIHCRTRSLQGCRTTIAP